MALFCFGGSACFSFVDFETQSGCKTPPLDPDAGCSDPVILTAGGLHSCVLRNNKTAWCWGDNRQGQIGANSKFSIDTAHSPKKVFGLNAVSSISAGWRHTCAVNDGEIYCWGANRFGQLGIDPSIQSGYATRPVQVEGTRSKKWKTVFSGGKQTCAETIDDEFWCWGDNTYGQAGQTVRDDWVWVPPTKVQDLAGVKKLSSGRSHVCLHTASLTSCWGQANAGKTTRDPFTDQKQWRLPAAWSFEPYGVVDVSAGKYHSCAVLDSGEVWCWGSRSRGQIGIINTESSTQSTPNKVQWQSAAAVKIVKVYAGALHSCALSDEARAYCWGGNKSAQLATDGAAVLESPQLLRGLDGQPITGITQMAVGDKHSCLLGNGGTIQCWGLNDWGQSGQAQAEVQANSAASTDGRTVGGPSAVTLPDPEENGSTEGSEPSSPNNSPWQSDIDLCFTQLGETVIEAPNSLPQELRFPVIKNPGMPVIQTATVVLTACGTDPVSISGIIGLTSGSRFSITAPTEATVLAPGESFRSVVSYALSENAYADNEQIEFESSLPENKILRLLGSGYEDDLCFEVDGAATGGLTFQWPTTTRALTLRACNDGRVQITRGQIVPQNGTPSSAFLINGLQTISASLLDGAASRTLTVDYMRSSGGSFSVLEIWTASGQTYTLDLKGDAQTMSMPALCLTGIDSVSHNWQADSPDLPTLRFRAQNEIKTLEIKNCGTSALNVRSLSFEHPVDLFEILPEATNPIPIPIPILLSVDEVFEFRLRYTGGPLKFVSTRFHVMSDETADLVLPVVAGVTRDDPPVMLAAGLNHSCVVRAPTPDSTDQSVYCWGELIDLLAAPDPRVNTATPRQVDISAILEDDQQILEIEAGDGFTCTKNTAQKVHCWGDGEKKVFDTSAKLRSTVLYPTNSTSPSLRGWRAVKDIKIDAAGDQYLAIDFDEAIYFDAKPAVMAVAPSAVLAKRYSTGGNAWQTEILAQNAASEIHINAMVIDGDKNTYIVGDYTGNVDFDPASGQGNSDCDSSMTVSSTTAFVAKYNDRGNCVWVVGYYPSPMTSDDSSVALDIALDEGGGRDRLYVVGHFEGAFPNGMPPRQSVGGTRDAFFLILNKDGDRLETNFYPDVQNEFESFHHDELTAVEVDAAGNIVLLGTLFGQHDFNLPGQGGSSGEIGARQLMIAKYAHVATGNSKVSPVWAHLDEVTCAVDGCLPQADIELSNHVLTLDNAGNVYMAAHFSGEFSSAPPSTGVESGSKNIVYLRRNAAGVLLEISSIFNQVSYATVPRKLVFDSSHQLLHLVLEDEAIVGQAPYDDFNSGFDLRVYSFAPDQTPSSGLVSINHLGSLETRKVRAHTATVSASGDLFLGGRYQGEITFDGTHLPGPDVTTEVYDGFVLQIKPARRYSRSPVEVDLSSALTGNHPVPPAIFLSAGKDHACVRVETARKNVYCWGDNSLGQIDPRFMDVAQTDSNSTPQPIRPGGGRNALELSAGRTHSCMLLDDGMSPSSSSSMRCWGACGLAQCGDFTVPPVSDGFEQLIDVGATNIMLSKGSSDHTCYSWTNASMSEVTLECWGSHSCGQLAPTDTVTSTSTHQSVTSYAAGSQDHPMQVAVGGSFSCFVSQNSDVYCWGNHSVGQLGNGESPNLGVVPQPCDSRSQATVKADAASNPLTAVGEIRLGDKHGCALSSHGGNPENEVWCWGDDGFKQQAGNSKENYAQKIELPGVPIP